MKKVKRFCIFFLLLGLILFGACLIFKSKGKQKRDVVYNNYGVHKEVSYKDSSEEKPEGDKEEADSYKTIDEESYKEAIDSEEKMRDKRGSSSRGGYIPSERVILYLCIKVLS